MDKPAVKPRDAAPSESSFAMTTITFTFYALPPLPDGTHPVHLYLKQEEPTWDMSPGAERKAIKDAAQIVADLVRENDVENEERLLKEGEPPEGAFPVAFFTINVLWNRPMKLPHYTKGDYGRIGVGKEGRWNRVAQVMMELHAYTYGVLHKREKRELKKKLERKSKNAAN